VVQVARATAPGFGRVTQSVLATVISIIAVTALIGALTMQAGNAAPKGAPGPITLVFAGELGSEGLQPVTGGYPPIEGGAGRVYVVPDGMRLVIESMYAAVDETWITDQAGPRSNIIAQVSSWYNLGEQCAYPGYQRNYGISLGIPAAGSYDTENQRMWVGYTEGPIFVEGGRSVNGYAFAPSGNSTVIVHITVHGHLESATNPAPPVCGQP
jgi:hypothetical protein